MITVESMAMGELWMELIDRKALKRYMRIRGISQRRLAKAVGWKSHSYLGRLLRGEARNVDTDPALRMAHHLQVGVEDLFLTRVSTNNGLLDDFQSESETKISKVT